MQFQSYKVNNKHRVASPTKFASIWTVSEWVEIQLFCEASRKEWQAKNILWAIHGESASLLQIGLDTENNLYIAKFRCDHNNEWHGYPICPRKDDIPPESVLEKWRQDGKIDKKVKRHIQTGKFNP